MKPVTSERAPGWPRITGAIFTTARYIKRRSKGLNIVARRRFKANLQYLHDTLDGTDLAGKYWLFGGLLLGWARDGRVIAWDYRDADVAFRSEDIELFWRARPRIIAAGFRPSVEWRNNSGDITLYTFERDGARFEFYLMYPDGNKLRYFVYGIRGGIWQEIVCAVPSHGLAQFKFLDRVWLKPDDHEAYLRTVYGDWRRPDPL